MSEPRGPARRLIVRKSSEIEGNTGEKWADRGGAGAAAVIPSSHILRCSVRSVYAAAIARG